MTDEQIVPVSAPTQAPTEAPFYMSLKYRDALTMADVVFAIKAWSAEELESRALWATEYVAEHMYQMPAVPEPTRAAPVPSAAGPQPAHAGPMPAAQQQAAPGKPAGEDKSGSIKVATIKHGVTPNGKHYINCKGQPLMKFGVTAYEERADEVPAWEGWREWPIGTEYIQNEPLIAHHDGKKVLRFE